MLLKSNMHSVDINSLLGSNLKRIREGKGISQKVLADMIDTDPPRISEWEAGRRGIGKDILSRLCAALGVEPYEFYIKDEQQSLFPKDPFERDALETLRAAEAVGVAEDGMNYMKYLVTAKGGKSVTRPKPPSRDDGLETVEQRLMFFRTMVVKETIEDFAEKIAMTATGLEEVESGGKAADAQMITRILEAYHGRFDHIRLMNWLMTGQGNPPEAAGEVPGGATGTMGAY
jgi:transcriptional regulator with XRE-family HTH domain